MPRRVSDRTLILAILVALVALPLVVYVADALVLRLRGDRALESMRMYLGTPLKSGRVELFTDQPTTEICAHSLFPHFGYRPCWYVRRSGGVKVI